MSIFIVMAIVLGIMNLTTRSVENSQINYSIDIITAGGGTIAQGTDTDKEGEDIASYGMAYGPEYMFSIRYFSALINKSGAIDSANTENISAISDKEATQWIDKLSTRSKDAGRFCIADSYYQYKATKQESGETLFVAVDCTDNVRSMHQVLVFSFRMGILCIMFFVIVVTLLSKRVVRPFARNIEDQKMFITNASHELKTPLAIISADTEMLETLKGGDEWTRSISGQVNRLNGLINDLISLAKADEKDEFQAEDVNFSDIVADAANQFKPVADQQNKKLTTDIRSDIHVLAEKNLLQELANILIDNATKYCDDSGEIKVSLTKKTGDKRAQFSVSNTYANSAKADTKRFFNRFYRGDVSHNSQKSGHGIGLSIAKNITEQFHGRIGAAAKNGVMTFTVHI